MKQIKLKKVKRLSGEFVAPGDKSISQRAVMISALARGKTAIYNFLDCQDCRKLINAMRKMGVKINFSKNSQGKILEVYGVGLSGLKKPTSSIYLGNSGTSTRLISGILAAQKFRSVLTGDESLSCRPMKRITDPLRKMGADIKGEMKRGQEYLPLVITGQQLKAIRYKMPIKSAQVKSAVLLAGLFAAGKTQVLEKIKTRDHTERMLKLFKADIYVRGMKITVRGEENLTSPGRIFIPGDISSCLFFIVAATIIPGSSIVIRNVGLNPTRSYILSVLKRMGANIRILNKERRLNAFEPSGDLLIRARALRAVTLNKKEVAFCIDELPIICVAACFAKGTTRITGAGELRVKETDRIFSIFTNLRKMGAKIRNVGNDLIITGDKKLQAARLDSFNDHRTLMSMAVAGLLAEGTTVIKNPECINKSFPNFMSILENLRE